MGFLSSLKRLFFTTESVAKSAAEKAVDYTTEKASEIAQSAKESVGEMVDKSSGLRQAVVEKASAVMDKVEDVAETAWEKTKDLADAAAEKIESVTSPETNTQANTEFVEPVQASVSSSTPSADATPEPSTMDKIMTTASDLADKTKAAAESAYEKLAENETIQKAGEFTEKVGSQVMEKGSEWAEKAASATESLGSKVMESGSQAMEKLSEKASQVSEQVSKKLDETMEKAEKFMAEENAKPKQEFSDKDLNAGGSLLEGKDDFFSKAADYAAGDYDAFKEGKVNVNPAPVELPKDELDTEKFDDAIIVDDNETPQQP